MHRAHVGNWTALCVLWLSTNVYANGYWKYQHGRQDREDGGYYPMTTGIAWKTADVVSNLSDPYPLCWQFDSAFPQEEKDAWETALNAAGDEWEKYANITLNKCDANPPVAITIEWDDLANDPSDSFGKAHAGTGTPITAMRISFDSAPEFTEAKPGWNDSRRLRVATHEFGHALGLDDLYHTYTEEFVDHPLIGNNLPDRGGGYSDNVMSAFDSSVNPDHVMIDNDEVAAVTWLWGGKQHQIVTGHLGTTWSNDANEGLATLAHHGDQPTLGTWVYRASVAKGTNDEMPLISLEFAGYSGFSALSYPACDWVHVAGPGNTQFFQCQTAGWVGNVELFVQSTVNTERLITATISGGGQTDLFDINPNLEGLAHSEDRHWAKVFGPTPEPGTAVLFLTGLSLLARRQRFRKMEILRSLGPVEGTVETGGSVPRR